MATQFETGHARNLAAFQTIISYCTGYGSKYKPLQDNLQIAALQTQLSNAEAALTEAKNKQIGFINATNSRVQTFEPVKSLAMRIIYALAAGGVSKQTLDSAKTFKRKIVGKRVSKIEKTENPEEAAEKYNSSSQQSFDQILSSLMSLIQLVESQAGYQPSEDDLQITALKDYASTLKTSNTNVINAKTDWSASRSVRDELIYGTGTGILDTAQQIKNYIRSIFGPSDNEYKKVSGIQISGIKV